MYAMLRCYACGGFPTEDGDTEKFAHADWCEKQDCPNCKQVFRGYIGAQNCPFCLDPKGKKRYENDAGAFVPLLNSKGKSNLDQETGLVV